MCAQQVEGTPMGCAGHLMRICGAIAPLCYGCARFGLEGKRIEAGATIDKATLVWHCADRLSNFAFVQVA